MFLNRIKVDKSLSHLKVDASLQVPLNPQPCTNYLAVQEQKSHSTRSLLKKKSSQLLNFGGSSASLKPPVRSHILSQASSVASSSWDLRNPGSPSTPAMERTPSHTSMASFYTTDEDALYDVFNVIDPVPAAPPSYNDLPPGGIPKFCIFPRHTEGSEALPCYIPSVYKLFRTERKVEWISPYEPSTSRSWKDCIVEINNTQLNIYGLVDQVKHFKYDSTKIFGERGDLQDYTSRYTTDEDLQFMMYCQNFKVLVPSNLLRSYSLQHAVVGSANDFTKRKNCMRVRAETEQFLFHFKALEDMIDCHTAMSNARDVSLDLALREMPKYRTVPRRRRRDRRGGTNSGTGNRNRSYSDTELIRRSLNERFFKRGNSASSLHTLSINNPLKNKLFSRMSFSRSKDRTASSPSSVASSPAPQDRGYSTRGSATHSRISSSAHSSITDIMSSNAPHTATTELTPQSSSNENERLLLNRSSVEEQDEQERQQNDEYQELLFENENLDDMDEEDIDDIHDIAESDDEDETNEGASGMVEVASAPVTNSPSSTHLHPFMFNNFYEDDGDRRGTNWNSDIKWRPLKKFYPHYKTVRNKARCLNLLPVDEQWAGKPVVCATITPNYIDFIQNINFNKFGSSPSLVSLFSKGSAIRGDYQSPRSGSSARFSSRDINSSVNKAARIPEHYTRQYTVSPGGLVPA
ncbi:hypothetical protein BABINDRAFT_158984 [Babjeviella inositovora NRRL Y-12698]|uniref:PH domain-containing protein n=1 Tax=Babjeviella inositovora NRRL Y-12698 TaxID=984486 RepID=A0A1E3QZ64_9ASCO|nr:uncharacterized protein BABINDRAFT_158984 [Babjeviella inositovora NRRL Y-12698]ODQ82377.1 hypothetical protein BABINDRAFT_158984 [Babjeviella inositovora NRRL Y-12698]